MGVATMGRMTQTKSAALIGAATGFALFLTTALLPAAVYGGYAGLLLAAGIFGSPLEPTLLARALVAFSAMLGTVATCSLYTVAGGVVGSLIGHLVSEQKKSPAEV